MLDEEEGGTRRKEGQGGRRDEEEGGTRRKEGRGGRRDAESEKMKKSLKDASLASLGLVFYLDVSSYLCSTVCPSVGRWVRRSVTCFLKMPKKDSFPRGNLHIFNC